MENKQLAGRLIAVCCGVLIVALFIVGVSAHEVNRHLIQSAPLWIGMIFGARGDDLGKWAGLALCLFWLGIAGLIGLHLTGVAHIINGYFPPLEVAMTVMIGAASLIGVGLALMAKSSLRAPAAIAVFVVMAALQAGAMALALQPDFAHDHGVSIVEVD